MFDLSSRYAFAASLEKIIIWKLGEGSKDPTFSNGDSNATCLLVSKHDSYLIADYQHG